MKGDTSAFLLLASLLGSTLAAPTGHRASADQEEILKRQIGGLLSNGGDIRNKLAQLNGNDEILTRQLEAVRSIVERSSGGSSAR